MGSIPQTLALLKKVDVHNKHYKHEYNPDYLPKCEHSQGEVTGCVSAEIFMACIKERDELYAEMEKKYKKKIKKLKEKIEYLQKQIPLDESLFNFGSTESNSPVTKNWNCDGTCVERITDLATGKTTKVGRVTKL